MTSVTIGAERLHALAAQFSGGLLQPGDDGYEQARLVHNGLIDKRPALIARCAGPEDVAAAIRFARELGLEISVRGGGHNVAGRAVTDGGVMIDLATLKRIEVDPGTRTVRAQGGVNWGELNAATHEHGLAVTGGQISTTGIAGLTLGGGLGWLMGKHGLAADNLLEVELVTADGRVRSVTDDSDADLMWALRGGGGNFGVAVSFVYRLHPVTTVTGGVIAHPFEQAGEMLRFYRDAVAGCSDDLVVFAGLVHAPDGSGTKLAVMVLCHAGSVEQAEAELAPFREWGAPVTVQVEPMPYPVMNTILDGGYPPGAFNYWLSSFVTGLTDGLIDSVVDRFASAPSPMTGTLFEHFHGAVTRVGITDTPVPHRGEGWNLLVLSEWTDPAATATNIAWTKETFAALSEHFAPLRWLSYLGDDEDDRVRAAYGPNYERLVELKRRYDPDNVFHLNHNIVP
jgi:FAD/FMN-containing dehydrogenase